MSFYEDITYEDLNMLDNETLYSIIETADYSDDLECAVAEECADILSEATRYDKERAKAAQKFLNAGAIIANKGNQANNSDYDDYVTAKNKAELFGLRDTKAAQRAVARSENNWRGHGSYGHGLGIDLAAVKSDKSFARTQANARPSNTPEKEAGKYLKAQELLNIKKAEAEAKKAEAEAKASAKKAEAEAQKAKIKLEIQKNRSIRKKSGMKDFLAQGNQKQASDNTIKAKEKKVEQLEKLLPAVIDSNAAEDSNVKNSSKLKDVGTVVASIAAAEALVLGLTQLSRSVHLNTASKEKLTNDIEKYKEEIKNLKEGYKKGKILPKIAEARVKILEKKIKKTQDKIASRFTESAEESTYNDYLDSKIAIYEAALAGEIDEDEKDILLESLDEDYTDDYDEYDESYEDYLDSKIAIYEAALAGEIDADDTVELLESLDEGYDLY